MKYQTHFTRTITSLLVAIILGASGIAAAQETPRLFLKLNEQVPGREALSSDQGRTAGALQVHVDFTLLDPAGGVLGEIQADLPDAVFVLVLAHVEE